MLVALLVGLIYTLSNFFGEAPAVQVSSGKATLKVDASLVPRVEQALTGAGLHADFVQLDGTSVRTRFTSTDNQLKARDAIDKALNHDPADPSYIVALNLLSRSPQWLTSLHALVDAQREYAAEPRDGNAPAYAQRFRSSTGTLRRAS